MSSSNVKVFVRFRPLNARERLESTNEPSPVRGSQRDSLRSPRSPRTELSLVYDDTNVEMGASKFAFDNVFGAASTQEEVFAKVASDSCDDLMAGYNATLFAYGQTGAGKSFSMFGLDSQPGILNRCVERIFAHIEDDSSSNGTVWTVEASFLEIYMEQLRDLLNSSASPPPLQIREHQKRIWVDNLKDVECRSPEDVLRLITQGEAVRATASTGMNETSSRSHSVFTLNVTASRKSGTTKARFALIDLAGSERVGRTGATGQTLAEARKINQSLSALGNVINALSKSDSSSSDHVPFRDSQLTRLLQEALQGNCKTRLLVACSPHESSFEETVSSLRFAIRAKSIATRAVKNESRNVDELEALVRHLQEQLAKETAARIRAEEDLKEMQQNGYLKNGTTKVLKMQLESIPKPELKTGLKRTENETTNARIWYEPSRSQFLEEMSLLIPSLFWLSFLTAE